MFFRLLSIVLILSVSAVATKKSPQYEAPLTRASDLLRSSEARSAESVFTESLNDALARQDEYYAARARVGLAGCYLLTHDYKKAVRQGELALRYGISNQDADVAVRAALNISSVYRRMGDFQVAAQTMREVNSMLPRITDPILNMQLYLHAAVLAARNRDWDKAERYFFAGIDAALNLGDMQNAANGWNQLGYMRLEQKELAKADAALTEAFRVRLLSRNRNVVVSYVYLARLRVIQGDPQSAVNLLDRALAVASKGEVSVPVSAIYRWRAKAKNALGDSKRAFADYAQAVEWATKWRHEGLPTDSFRVSLEVELDAMFGEYIQTGMRSWASTRNADLARLMFEISEQHRSASFRELSRSGESLPPEYWDALKNYRAALTSSWATGATGDTEAARLVLARIESQLGLAAGQDNDARASQIQRRLSADEALISFHTGEEQSWVWAMTRDAFEAHALPGRQAILDLAKEYRAAIENEAPYSEASIKLHAILFGQLSPSIQSKPDWLLSLDQGLYDVPFAALGPAKAPLIVSHSLRTVPGAALLNRPSEAVSSARFIGAGDAIYNAADSRWNGPKISHATQFARLVNTKHEVAAAAEAWTADRTPTLLLGETFNRANLDVAFRAEPAVVHIAAHVVRDQADGKQVMIGIGLSPEGAPDFLTTSDVASKPLRAGLVSINGCGSGAGATLPGAGLIGLTRAWLLAGATAVAATYWPVDDDRGDLFAAMYREISANSGTPTITAASAARALQSAQIAAWKCGTERATPRHWAAVFLAGKG